MEAGSWRHGRRSRRSFFGKLAILQAYLYTPGDFEFEFGLLLFFKCLDLVVKMCGSLAYWCYLMMCAM